MMGSGLMGRGSINQGMWGTGRIQTPDGTAPAEAMPISDEKALEPAQQYLDVRIKGSVTDRHATPFYGYYTIYVLDNDKTIGMLGVNGYSGDVWFHDRHGDFISMTESITDED